MTNTQIKTVRVLTELDEQPTEIFFNVYKNGKIKVVWRQIINNRKFYPKHCWVDRKKAEDIYRAITPKLKVVKS